MRQEKRTKRLAMPRRNFDVVHQCLGGRQEGGRLNEMTRVEYRLISYLQMKNAERFIEMLTSDDNKVLL